MALRVLVLFCFSCFYVVDDEVGDIRCGVKNEIEYVNQDYATPNGKLASDKSADRRFNGGEEEGVHFEEHVVGIDPREVNKVSNY